MQVLLNANTDAKMTLCLEWLLLEERIDSSILKLVYDGINKENLPANLKLELKNPTRALRNNSGKTIIVAKDKNMNKFFAVLQYNIAVLV